MKIRYCNCNEIFQFYETKFGKQHPSFESVIYPAILFLQDILDALEIERVIEDGGDSLLMYIPLDKKPNTQEQDIPELPEIPSVIPVRVGKSRQNFVKQVVCSLYLASCVL